MNGLVGFSTFFNFSLNLVDWDKNDIKDYVSAKEMYCPANTNLSLLYEISDEVDAEYKNEQEKAIKEELEGKNDVKEEKEKKYED